MTRSSFSPRCKLLMSVVFDGRGAPNSKPLMLEVAPRTCSIAMNGYHEGSTWNADIEARVLPFDPDQVASIAVRIYMWDSEGDENREWALEKYEMLRGLVDENEAIVVGDDNIVRFTGRDYIGLLDVPWDPKRIPPNGIPLDEAVQEIADNAAPPGTHARFQVVWAAEGDPRDALGIKRSTKKKGDWVKPGKSTWDVIYDLCIASGFIVYVKGSQIIITDPQTQTKDSLDQAPKLAYGKHLLKLEVKRKFGREKVPQIVISAYDPTTGAQFEVIYPEKRNVIVDALGRPNITTVINGIAVKKDEQLYFPAPKGIYNRDALLRYAKMRFYHLGRGESTYKFTTRHLKIPKIQSSAFESLLPEYDMLQLRPGNPIGILFDPFNREHLRALTVGARTQHLIALGYRAAIASFIASNLESINQYQQPYYANKIVFDYDEQEGLEVGVTAMNFASQLREVHFADQSDAQSGIPSVSSIDTTTQLAVDQFGNNTGKIINGSKQNANP